MLLSGDRFVRARAVKGLNDGVVVGMDEEGDRAAFILPPSPIFGHEHAMFLNVDQYEWIDMK